LLCWICDFEGIGHKIPKGTSVDASNKDSSLMAKHQVRMHRSNIGKENKKPKNGTTKAFALAINTGSAREVKMSSLCLLLEFGSSEDKEKAREELTAIAY